MLSSFGLNFGSNSRRDLASTSGIGNLTIPSIKGTDGSASIQNFASNDFTLDYAIVFSCTSPATTTVNKGSKTPPKTTAATQDMRIDVTLVPKIQRNKQKSSALVCLPGSSDGIKSAELGVPKQGACPSLPNRPASFILDNGTFEGLHPEEKDWVSKRLQKVAPKTAAFVQKNLPAGILPSGASVDQTKASLKIGISISGGGKRSLFNAAGKF